MEESTPTVSNSIASLEKIIHVEFPAQSVRWETFGTPEYQGGVPGPTDYMTLIAEFTANDFEWFDRLSKDRGDFYIVPEAARPWLSTSFNTLLKNRKNSTMPLPSEPDCRALRVKLKKASDTAKAFACRDASRILLYVKLWSSQ